MHMANRDIINSILKMHLLDVVLPKVFKSYNNKLAKHNAYMVIIGGVSVEMCAATDKNAQLFLRDVFSEDVDIKLVLENDENVDKDAILDIRQKFITTIVRRLKSFVKKNQHEWDRTIAVNIVLDDSLMKHHIASVRNAMVLSVAIEYVESKFRIRYPLMDTTFFSKSIAAHFDIYKNMLKSQTHVPYYTAKNVNFATCQYMMYDTCRMLIERAQYLREKRTLFALMKFTKYVIKFMSLYVLRKRIMALPNELLNIYDKSHKTLLSINKFKLKKGFKKMHDVKYDMTYVENVISGLDTILQSSDMNQLVKAIKRMNGI